MTATTSLAGVYDITSSLQSIDVDINTTSGSTYKIKKLPQIIYLGKSNLYWQDKGTEQAPETSVTYTLNDTDVPGLETVSTIHQAQQGASTQIIMQILPPASYYWIEAPIFTGPAGVTAIASLPIEQGDAIEVTIDVVSQGIDGSEIILEYNGFGKYEEIPQIDILLEYVTIPENTAIQYTATPQTYTFGIGLTNTIILTASQYYGWISAMDDISFAPNITPIGSTITINSATFTGIEYINSQITLDVTITVPIGTPDNTIVNFSIVGNPGLVEDFIVQPVMNSDYPFTAEGQTTEVSFLNGYDYPMYVKLFANAFIEVPENITFASIFNGQTPDNLSLTLILDAQNETASGFSAGYYTIPANTIIGDATIQLSSSPTSTTWAAQFAWSDDPNAADNLWEMGV